MRILFIECPNSLTELNSSHEKKIFLKVFICSKCSNGHVDCSFDKSSVIVCQNADFFQSDSRKKIRVQCVFQKVCILYLRLLWIRRIQKLHSCRIFFDRLHILFGEYPKSLTELNSSHEKKIFLKVLICSECSNGHVDCSFDKSSVIVCQNADFFQSDSGKKVRVQCVFQKVCIFYLRLLWIRRIQNYIPVETFSTDCVYFSVNVLTL